MALTDAAVRAAKLPDGKKQIKLADGHGLYLLVNKSGKYWRYDYKLGGKRKTLAIGTYPDTKLAGHKNKIGGYIPGARDIVLDAKSLVKQGVDPSQKKQDDKRDNLARTIAAKDRELIDSNTFKQVALSWFNLHKEEWEYSYSKTIIRRFEQYVFPSIGTIPVAQLTKVQVADTMTAIVSLGIIDTCKRVIQITRNVLEYACDRGLIDAIPLGNTKSLLPARKTKPMPAITEPKKIGNLMRAIYAYGGTYVVCQALRLLPLLAVRSGEFRQAEWDEFDFEKALWTIPAPHRKIKKTEKQDPENVHLVPLSSQAIDILKHLHKLTGNGKHVFPSARGDTRPMSENTINAALHAMGFKDEMVGHGVRSMFSTSMNPEGFNPDAIERQLAHSDGNTIRGTYNRAEYMQERIAIMQHWADYLDRLRTESDTS